MTERWRYHPGVAKSPQRRVSGRFRGPPVPAATFDANRRTSGPTHRAATSAARSKKGDPRGVAKRLEHDQQNGFSVLRAIAL